MSQIVANFVKELQSTSGTLAKAAVLKEVAQDQDVRRYLHAVYDPTINYYIAKVQFVEVAAGEVSELSDWLPHLAALSTRRVTGNAARAFLQDLYASLDEDQRVLLKLLLNRNIKAGVAAGSINKVMPGLIREVPYQRCCLPKDSKIAELKWEEGVFVQLKADGSFANLYTGENPVIETRNGSIYEYGLDKLRAALRRAPQGLTMHGELLVRDLETGMVLPRTKGNGILNSISQDGEVDPRYEVIADVWDMIPSAEMVMKGRYEVPYADRLAKLRQCAHDVDPMGKVIKVIETDVVYSRAEAKGIYVEYRKQGLEGTVIKSPDAIWLDGDNPFQIKEKVEVEVDLVIKGYKQGDADGKYAHTLGSLICQSSDGLIEVGVSGMTDAARDEFWNNQDYYLDKVVAVIVNGFLKNDKAEEKDSLFLPRLTPIKKGSTNLVEIRHDKNEADDSQRIINMIDEA